MKHLVREQLRLKTSYHELMLLMRIEKWICRQEPPWCNWPRSVTICSKSKSTVTEQCTDMTASEDKRLAPIVER